MVRQGRSAAATTRPSSDASVNAVPVQTALGGFGPEASLEHAAMYTTRPLPKTSRGRALRMDFIEKGAPKRFSRRGQNGNKCYPSGVAWFQPNCRSETAETIGKAGPAAYYSRQMISGLVPVSYPPPFVRESRRSARAQPRGRIVLPLPAPDVIRPSPLPFRVFAAGRSQPYRRSDQPGTGARTACARNHRSWESPRRLGLSGASEESRNQADYRDGGLRLPR